ncbi:T. brucei spp.-specific protein [Trypanosoma brucei gambiense DAL972]|uniref:T. brucei spp.-specific protein n=1 Tax=Trypanosoma brucei gambiense (strain MHOM/CI/86/DAL972) TaxID=679716 RepID=C9ZQE3_TRYB9|nr:T. brucei spp.-specific protein [Trypanosoma brucei gambiense DAL972]CBH11623.1 T. brucei spp.-specific protein [Trypanosoma brucei gambiense DAL972]|eukprot:XP_011773908.1 T. brucei spp.-specific protein [Trypanosoma brucei gambiense DAL972]
MRVETVMLKVTSATRYYGPLRGSSDARRCFRVGCLKKDSLAMPATSTWCQGPVPRIIGGSQEPAAFLSWGTLLCSGYGIIQHRDQQRLAGTPFFICRSLGTCQRAISSIIRAKMLLSGDVDLQKRIANWHLWESPGWEASRPICCIPFICGATTKIIEGVLG